MAGKEVSFEEQITALRELIAGVLEDEEDWGEAAKVRNSTTHRKPLPRCIYQCLNVLQTHARMLGFVLAIVNSSDCRSAYCLHRFRFSHLHLCCHCGLNVR